MVFNNNSFNDTDKRGETQPQTINKQDIVIADVIETF